MGNVAELRYLDQAVYAPRPVLSVKGARDEGLEARLMGFVLHDRLDGLAALQLQAADWVVDDSGVGAYAHATSSALRMGARFQVAFAEQTLFSGRISALGLNAGEHQAPLMTLCAEDPLMAARQARHTRAFERSSLGEVLQQVLSNLGLNADLQGLPEAEDVWVQANESDLAFARRLLAAHDATLLMQGDRVWVGPQTQVPGSDIELSLGGQLREVQVQADLAQQCTQVSVTGFDAAQGSSFQATSSGSQPGPGAGQRGDALLAQALGPRPEHLAGQVARTQAQAQALAHAAFDQRLRRFVTVRGSAEGLPLLRAGTRLSLQGLGPWFSNRYQVSEVWHRFDLQQGYRTDFVAHSAFMGQA
jgi:uncharacterized protein